MPREGMKSRPEGRFRSRRSHSRTIARRRTAVAWRRRGLLMLMGRPCRGSRGTRTTNVLLTIFRHNGTGRQGRMPGPPGLSCFLRGGHFWSPPPGWGGPRVRDEASPSRRTLLTLPSLQGRGPDATRALATDGTAAPLPLRPRRRDGLPSNGLRISPWPRSGPSMPFPERAERPSPCPRPFLAAVARSRSRQLGNLKANLAVIHLLTLIDSATQGRRRPAIVFTEPSGLYGRLLPPRPGALRSPSLATAPSAGRSREAAGEKLAVVYGFVERKPDGPLLPQRRQLRRRHIQADLRPHPEGHTFPPTGYSGETTATSCAARRPDHQAGSPLQPDGPAHWSARTPGTSRRASSSGRVGSTDADHYRRRSPGRGVREEESPGSRRSWELVRQERMPRSSTIPVSLRQPRQASRTASRLSGRGSAINRGKRQVNVWLASA